MIIAIDASRVIKEKPTGTEVYSTRLILNLAQLDKSHTYYLYTPTNPPSNFPKLPANWHWKVIPLTRFWTQIRLSLAMLIDKPDLLFVPAHVLPLFRPKKCIVTIHDLAYELFPESYNLLSLWYLKYATYLAVNYASHIITPSLATKNDLIKRYPQLDNKVTAIHLGYDRLLNKIKNQSLDLKIKKLQPYFIMIGRLEKKKNIVKAIEAFNQFRQNHPECPHKLVLIGQPGYGYEEILAVKLRLPIKIQNDIIELGYLSDEELSSYRKNALALLYLSLYEGFGLPLLDAMATNLPIIASDTGAIPEIVGDAAITVKPDSMMEIADALSLLATNNLTGEQIVNQGKQRIKEFSWEKTASLTLNLFNQILKD